MSRKLTLEYVQATGLKKGFYLNSENYTSNLILLEWSCIAEWHPVSITYGNISNNKGCPECFNNRRGKSQRLTVDQVRNRGFEKGFYLNSENYTSNHLKLDWSCRAKWHPFKSRWNDIDNNEGCPGCYKETFHKNAVSKRIACSIRSRFSTKLKTYIKTKKCSSIGDLGCSWEEFLIYMEGLFQPGMSWGNYGEWHVDHIKPLAKCDLDTAEGQREAVHYTNLQPLWALDNLIKGAKYSEIDLDTSYAISIH